MGENTSWFCKNISVDSSAIPHMLLLQNLSQGGRRQGDFCWLFFTYLRSAFQWWPLRRFLGSTPANGLGLPHRCLVHPRQRNSVAIPLCSVPQCSRQAETIIFLPTSWSTYEHLTRSECKITLKYKA